MRPLEATSLASRPLRSALKATRSHREALLSRLEAAGRPPRASRSRWETPQEVSRLENTRENSRKLRLEPLGPREPLEPRDGCSQSLWNLAMAAPRASGASRWPLPEPLEPRDSCSQSLWSLEIAAPRAPGASHSCSQSLWSLQEAAPRASGASRWLMPRGNSRGDGRRSFEALRRP